jgi:hypothetical protein|tara:strand:- start:250 stop:456 length:207 start_codon:yes stop_codon:yes gene_type:complete
MKRSGWVLYLFEDDNKKEIFKIMEFKTIKELSYVIKTDPSIISNWYHGLINPRGILKNCMLVQSVPIV